MARKKRLLNALLTGVSLLAGLPFPAAAQQPVPVEESTETTPPRPNPAPGKRAKRQGANSPEMENVRRALEALTPEQVKRFQDNFLRWSNLSPEEKKALRDQDETRRKKMVADVDMAIREAGLILTHERRQEFIRRYAQERRKIEEQLRKEMEEKRRPLLREIRERLKQEFSSPAAASPAGTPSTP